MRTRSLITSSGVLFIVAAATAGSIFLLDVTYLRPQVHQQQQAAFRERTSLALMDIELTIHAERRRIMGICNAWSQNPAMQRLANDRKPAEALADLAAKMIDPSIEAVWLTNCDGTLLATWPDVPPSEGLGPLPCAKGAPGRPFEGFVRTDRGPAIFVTVAILDSRDPSRCLGRLWQTRTLDSTLLRKAATAIGGAVKFVPAARLPKDPDPGLTYASWNVRDHLNFAYPAKDIDGDMIGYFQADVPMTAAHHQARTVRYATLIVLGLSTGTALLVFTGLHMMISRPIDRLVARARKMVGAHAGKRGALWTGELETAFDHLARMSHTDPLTGLANRRHFEEALGAAHDQARRYGRALSIMAVDLDHLKAINDQGGHGAGDRALQLIAMALRKTCRRADLPARIGGDEFAVLLPETTTAEASALADRLRACTADDADSYRIGTDVTVSVGIADLNAGVIDQAYDLLHLADHALYVAKSGGRDRVALAEDPTRIAGDLPSKRPAWKPDHAHGQPAAKDAGNRDA